MKRKSFLRTGMLWVTMLIAASAFGQSAGNYRTKIETINREIVKNTLEGNYEKNLDYYTKDAISLPNYDPILEGIDALRRANEEMAKSEMKITSYEPTTLKVIPNGNMIIEIGTYSITLSVPGVDRSINEYGKYLTIWEKQKDGSLKIKIETWNSDSSPKIKKPEEDHGNMI